MKDSGLIKVPIKFASEVIAERGEMGKEWLESLPTKVATLCSSWNLIIDGKPMHGHLGLVVPTRRGTELSVLKITWIDEAFQQEIIALQAWRGHGAVRILDVKLKEGAVLLERLDFNHSLEGVDIQEAVVIAANLLRQLAVPAPLGLSTLPEHVEKMSLVMSERWQQTGRPFPIHILKVAQDTAQYLARSASDLLVDHDLHYGNVLASDREPWLVIDPKVLAGDPEFGLFPLLLRRTEEANSRADFEHRLSTLISIAKLDARRARGWTLVRAVDYWLWALSVGYTEDPVRCAAITGWLLGDTY